MRNSRRCLGILVGAILFAIGIVGFLSRRNLIVMFLATEIVLIPASLRAAKIFLGVIRAVGLKKLTNTMMRIV